MASRTVCKSEDHQLAECPFVVYSANVDSSEEQMEEQKKKDRESYRAKLDQAKEKQQVAEKQHVRLRVEKNESQPTKEKDSGKNSGKDKKVRTTERTKEKTMEGPITTAWAKTMVRTTAAMTKSSMEVRRNLRVTGDGRAAMRGRGEIVAVTMIGNRRGGESAIVTPAAGVSTPAEITEEIAHRGAKIIRMMIMTMDGPRFRIGEGATMTINFVHNE